LAEDRLAARPAIRPASAADLPRIAEIVERAYSVYIPRVGRRPGPMDDDYAERVRCGQVLVAESDTVVGLIVLLASGEYLLIENVAVHPECQHQGVGRALLAHAEALAAGRGLREVRLYTHATMTENIQLYRRLRYVQTDPFDQAGGNRVFFRKRIA
jgi:ribosomal protein S18 acetylase RimI-like enzyme